ncbi:MAG: hypothetical protein WA723_18960, partial [Pseudolabrys sp.]
AVAAAIKCSNLAVAPPTLVIVVQQPTGPMSPTVLPPIDRTPVIDRHKAQKVLPPAGPSATAPWAISNPAKRPTRKLREEKQVWVGAAAVAERVLLVAAEAEEQELAVGVVADVAEAEEEEEEGEDVAQISTPSTISH